MKELRLRPDKYWEFANRAKPIFTQDAEPPAGYKGALAVFDDCIIVIDNEGDNTQWNSAWAEADDILKRHGV